MRSAWIVGCLTAAALLVAAAARAQDDAPAPKSPVTEETAAAWQKHTGDLPFVIGPEAGKEEAAFAGRAVMYFFTSKKDKWCPLFAKRSFTDKTVLKRVAAYTPVLVEKEKHPELVEKLMIAILPSVVWVDADDEVIFSAMGDAPLELFQMTAEIAETRAPEPKPTEGWNNLSKLADTLDTHLQAGDTASALATIVEIRAVRLGAPFQARARAADRKITADGEERLAEAETLYATKRPKKRKAAREMLDAMIEAYGEHPVGVRAAAMRKLDGRKPPKKRKK